MAKGMFEFVKAAIDRPMEVATLFPTRPPLAQRLLGFVDFSRPELVVELGPGTGAITRFIHRRIRRPNDYLGLEINENMVAYLRQQYPQLRFEAGRADQIKEFLGKKRATHVVSSLPWTVFPEEVQRSTIDAICRSMAAEGQFLTYVCVNAAWYPQARRFAKLLRENFREVEKTPIEWMNIPPAFIYRCRR